MSIVELREITETDLPAFFDHQREPAGVEMAAFVSREREPFMAHWARILADKSVVARTIVFDGRVAGYVSTFHSHGQRLVGYWIGQAFWGQGVATRGLAEFLRHDLSRPLHARVAKHNVGSVRVLEKCGFAMTGEEKGADGVDEFLLTLE